MHLDWWTIGLQTVNFAILVWLLQRFLYKPVLRMIDARKAEIDQQYDDAKATEDKANAHLAASRPNALGSPPSAKRRSRRPRRRRRKRPTLAALRPSAMRKRCSTARARR